MPRIPTVTQDSDRHFSHWIRPVSRGYLLACCDCGLVHDLEFMATKGGERVDLRTVQIKFRARRNIKATKAERAQEKRRKKYES